MKHPFVYALECAWLVASFVAWAITGQARWLLIGVGFLVLMVLGTHDVGHPR